MNTYQNAPETEKFGGDCLMREIMSDTPRTDEAITYKYESDGRDWEHVVPADFARHLERELNEARKDAELWHAVSKSTMELWDGVEMQDAISAWENEYRARLARGVTTDAEVKAHHAAMRE